MEKIQLIDVEKTIYLWWSKIRWLMVIILFAIGVLRVQQSPQTFPIIIFVTVFFGICILNLLYHLQILKSNSIFGTIQIILDVVFATMVVHLTGGTESSFVWIYLIAVITASLSVEKVGGFISALIGSVSLLALILFYDFKWLIPINDAGFNSDVTSQTIFLISYTGLFTTIAFISNFISDMLKQVSVKFEEHKKLSQEHEERIREKENLIFGNKKKMDKYQEVVKVATEISSIDHDLNNPLSIISLSVSRVVKAAREYKDDKLSKSGDQITEAINKMNGILVRLQKLKKLDLIQKERKTLQD